MVMFALATVPLINRVRTTSVKQVWFADDGASGGRVRALREWWDRLNECGPRFGYFPNASKTTLVVKAAVYDEAVKVFSDTSVQISIEGKRYLGGPLGTDDFAVFFFKSKVSSWVSEVERLAEFAVQQPHAAFTAFTHGLVGRWVFLTRISSITAEVLQPLECAIRHRLIPALTGQPPPNETTRRLLALPAKHGGLGLIDPTTLPAKQFKASRMISAPLVNNIVTQGGDALNARDLQRTVKSSVIKEKRLESQAEATLLTASLQPGLRRSVLVAQEKGASVWLTALPLSCHGFALHKGAFRDALALRYGWPLPHTPSKCVCGEAFSADHELICRRGGYPTLRHNEVRDLVASFLTEVCPNVSTEPQLQPLTGEQLNTAANTEEAARLDVKARGFWCNDGKDAFFDIRVFHPHASSYQNTELPRLYRQHERAKKSKYARRVLEIERGCFTPLVFTTSGGMAPEATTFFRRLAGLVSEKRGSSYSATMNWIRCCLSFSLLRSSLLCIRGSRSTQRTFCNTACNVALIAAECRL